MRDNFLYFPPFLLSLTSARLQKGRREIPLQPKEFALFGTSSTINPRACTPSRSMGGGLLLKRIAQTINPTAFSSQARSCALPRVSFVADSHASCDFHSDNRLQLNVVLSVNQRVGDQRPRRGKKAAGRIHIGERQHEQHVGSGSHATAHKSASSPLPYWFFWILLLTAFALASRPNTVRNKFVEFLHRS